MKKGEWRKVKPLVIFGRSNIFIKAFNTLAQSAFIEDELVSSLEMFVCEMYWNRSSNERLSINKVRYSIYCQREGKVTCSMLPPCLDVLKQHILRVNYQTSIWRKSLDQFMDINSPVDNGWCCMNDDKLDIQWMTSNSAPCRWGTGYYSYYCRVTAKYVVQIVLAWLTISFAQMHVNVVDVTTMMMMTYMTMWMIFSRKRTILVVLRVMIPKLKYLTDIKNIETV